MTKPSILPAVAILGGLFVSAAPAQTTPSPAPRIVVLPVEQVGSTEPGPQSLAAARKEAAAAMAEARQQCRHEADKQSRQDCLADAREDRDHLLETARSGRTP